jgi:disulfide oxidoreductase YuzD
VGTDLLNTNVMKPNYKILYTTNLGMFKFSDVNRALDNPESKNRIKRIAESMKTDGLLPHPIVVTSKMIIVDGQHRVKAAEISNTGVYYLVDESIPSTSRGIFNAAKKYNRDAKVWSKADYIHGLSAQGNENYKILEEFGKKYPMFSLTERMFLLLNSGTKNVDRTDFANGKFKIGSLETADKWANYLLQLRPYFEKGYNKSVFVRTLLTILEKKPEFNFEEFMKKVKLRPASIFLCGDKKSYARMIEEIYNYRRRNDEKLNLRF